FAPAQRLARLVAHAHGHVCMDDARLLREHREFLQLGVDANPVADEYETQGWCTLERNGGSRHPDGRPVIAAHGVERYRPRLRHVAGRPVPIIFGWQPGCPVWLPSDFARDHTLLQLRNNMIFIVFRCLTPTRPQATDDLALGLILELFQG